MILLLFNFSDTKFRYRMLKINCKVSNKTILGEPICRFRSIKRESYLTIRVQTIRMVPDAKITYISRRKNSDGYQKVMEIKDIEICKMLRNIAQAPFPVVQDFVNHARKMSGNFLNGCNIKGEISVVNATLANFSALEFFPQGDYMTTFLIFDDFDSSIFNATWMSHISKF